MQAIYVPKYKIYYRVSPKEPNVLQWSNKPFGPATQWQTAMRFGKPIRALDTDDKTGQGVVVLNDSSTYVGSGVRVWGRKFYPAGTRIYSLYAVGEAKEEKPMSKMKIKIHESHKVTETYRPSPLMYHTDRGDVAMDYDCPGIFAYYPKDEDDKDDDCMYYFTITYNSINPCGWNYGRSDTFDPRYIKINAEWTDSPEAMEDPDYKEGAFHTKEYAQNLMDDLLWILTPKN